MGGGGGGGMGGCGGGSANLHVYETCIMCHTCQPIIQFTGIKYSLFFCHYFGGYGHIGKWIQENIIFMRFCCFKLSKKIEKLLNGQLAHAITKCTLTGLVQ